MVDIIKRAGLAIPTSCRNERFYESIKEFLTRRTKTYNSSVYTYNMFYLESEKFLTVPRNFPIQDYVPSVNLIDRRHDGEPISINHNISLRSEAQKKAVEILMNNETGILQLAPGVGKTVISIYMIAERKRKSLILVHRDSLADQWRDRFLQFTNIQNSDIVRLSSSSFKKDLSKPIIIVTDQTLLSLLKRNREEFLVALNEANIGIFIADEVHTSVGAPTFSECSIHVPSKYSYGLSATPYRLDGNGDIIEFHLGHITSDDDLEGTMPARVTVLLLNYEIDTPKRYTYVHWGGEFQRARYLNLIRKSQPFLEVIKPLLSKMIKDNRQIICMVERVNLIEDLYKWAPTLNKSMFCGVAKLDTLQKQVTFATPGKCRDGIDAPNKDCVIITSPISNIEQLTGRVVRSAKDKKTPVIIDMVDCGSTRVGQTLSSRVSFYERKKWPIQYVILTNGQKRLIDKETAYRIIHGGAE